MRGTNTETKGYHYINHVTVYLPESLAQVAPQGLFHS